MINSMRLKMSHFIKPEYEYRFLTFTFYKQFLDSTYVVNHKIATLSSLRKKKIFTVTVPNCLHLVEYHLYIIIIIMNYTDSRLLSSGHWYKTPVRNLLNFISSKSVQYLYNYKKNPPDSSC